MPVAVAHHGQILGGSALVEVDRSAYLSADGGRGRTGAGVLLAHQRGLYLVAGRTQLPQLVGRQTGVIGQCDGHGKGRADPHVEVRAVQGPGPGDLGLALVGGELGKGQRGRLVGRDGKQQLPGGGDAAVVLDHRGESELACRIVDRYLEGEGVLGDPVTAGELLHDLPVLQQLDGGDTARVVLGLERYL